MTRVIDPVQPWAAVYEAKSKTGKPLTFSGYYAMVTVWMLAMSFGAGGFIWFGIASWHNSALSILSIGLGIFLVLISVARIVRKELENGTKEGVRGS